MTLTTGQTSFIFNIQRYIFVALCTSFSGYKEKLSLDINTLYQLFVRLHIILTPLHQKNPVPSSLAPEG